jgi:hypothetical protein
MDASLPGRAARLVAGEIGPVHLLQLCRHRRGGGVGGLGGGPLDRRWRDAVLVRKSFIVAGFIGATTVLLGGYADSLQMALFWNVVSLSLLGLVTANNLALCKLTLIPKQAVGLNTGLQQVATSVAGGVSASLSGWLLHTSGSYQLPMKAIFIFLLLGAASTSSCSAANGRRKCYTGSLSASDTSVRTPCAASYQSVAAAKVAKYQYQHAAPGITTPVAYRLPKTDRSCDTRQY